MRPFRLVPQLTRPPWGGERLATELHKGEGRIGESWEVWRDDVIVGDGRRFGEVVEFPVLVKLLDTRERLSVQVHPDGEAARRLVGAPHGKAEGWVILGVEPGARIAYGLRAPLAPATFRAHAESGAIEDDLAWLEPKPGDVIDVPPGTLHAIGGGVLLYEIQEPIDLTWRVYDWGRGRELHLEHALAVANLHPQKPTARRVPVSPGVTRLFDTPAFRLDEVRLPAVRSGWEALTVIEGEATVDGAPIERGGTVVLPPGEWAVGGDGVVLAARPGLPA